MLHRSLDTDHEKQCQPHSAPTTLNSISDPLNTPHRPKFDLHSVFFNIMRPSLLALPGDVQLRILRHATREKALPLVPTICASCRPLRDAVVANPTAVFQTIDLGYGWCRPSDDIICRESPRWSHATVVSLEGCATLSDASVVAVANNCPQLEEINLGGTKKLSTNH